MTTVTLTTLADFVLATGPSRITKIKQAIKYYKEGYSPKRDYWKGLREAIIALHKGNLPKESLDAVLRNISQSKINNYNKNILSYKKWLGRKKIQWVGVDSKHWGHGDLRVTVNPELGLKINDSNYLIKLYFKSEKPTPRRVEIIGHLLETSAPRNETIYQTAVMDVASGRLIKPNKTIESIDALLIGEAAAFSAMWSELS